MKRTTPLPRVCGLNQVLTTGSKRVTFSHEFPSSKEKTTVRKWVAGVAGIVTITAALLAGSELYAGEETNLCEVQKKQTCDQSVCPMSGSASTEG